MPNENIIDNLTIELQADVDKALVAIRKVGGRLGELGNTLNALRDFKLSGNLISKAFVDNLLAVSSALSSFDADKFGKFSNTLKALSLVDMGSAKDLSKASSGISTLTKLNDLDPMPLMKFASAVSMMDTGGIENLAQAAKGLREFYPIATMSKADSGKHIAQAFAMLENVDLVKIFELSQASANLSKNFASIASLSRSGGEKLTEVFKVLDNVNAAHIEEIAKASDGLSSNFSAFASISKTDGKGVGEAFHAFDSVDPSKIKAVADASEGLSSNFSSFAIFARHGGKGIQETLDAFKNADTTGLYRVGKVSSLLKNFSSLSSLVRSGGERISETFQALGNSVPILERVSRIDFSNMRDLADASRVIKRLQDRIKELDPNAKKTSKSMDNLARSTHQVRQATHRASHTFSLAHTALGKFFNSVKRIVFYRAIRSALRAITQGFAEGIENLYRWSQAWGTSFAPAMDQLKTAQTYLKNGFASMFSPLIEYAVPIIDRLVDKLVDMFNAVQELFAQLTGAATWNKAIKYPVKYKDDLDAAAGSAKALQNILMDFDEINAINTPHSGSRGSGKEVEDYSKMFELVQTSTKSDSALGKFIESLNKLNFDPLKNSLKNLWNDGINPILTYFKENGDKFLSPLVQFFVEEGLPTAIDLVTASLKPFLDIVKPLFESGFFEDVAGKLSKVNASVQKFADFLGTLDFSPIGEALSSLWNNTLSPIIDKLITYADFIREKVLQPITQFLVEKGIPAAIGAIESALSAIWSILEPILDGLQTFWEQNGTWIMGMIEEHTMTALEKIKEAFGAIGQFFKKNSDKIKGIFSNISTVVQYLAPVIKEIFGLIGTIGWDSFINGIHNTLDILQPILDVISGIFKIITVFFTGDAETAKSGLADIGTAIWNGILFPFKLVIRALATVLDVLGRIWPECKEGAHTLRVMIGDEAEYIEETVKGTGVKVVQEANGTFSALDSITGEYVTATGARLSKEEIEMNEAFAKMMSSGTMLGKSFKEQSELSVQWLAYCRDYGVDPTTGSIIMATEEMLKLGPAGQHAARDIVGAFSGALSYDSGNKLGHVYGSGFVNGVDAQNRGRTVGHTFGDAIAKNANSKELVNQFTSALSPTAGFNLGKQFGNAIQNGINPSAIGWNLGSQMAQSAQNALNMSPLQLKATINATINSVNANDKWRAALAAAGVSIAGFASGGFPPMSTGSLFVAGEGGVPELMGTVGGRTAVAGEKEITGIRDAIIEQGQREEGLLRQLISAVANKDLTLVANSKTGRWVNQSLRAYAGVTG